MLTLTYPEIARTDEAPQKLASFMWFLMSPVDNSRKFAAVRVPVTGSDHAPSRLLRGLKHAEGLELPDGRCSALTLVLL